MRKLETVFVTSFKYVIDIEAMIWKKCRWGNFFTLCTPLSLDKQATSNSAASVRSIVCGLPLEKGTSRPPDPSSSSSNAQVETRFYYDKDWRVCKKFTYGGHGGNLNNFPTAQECKEICGQDFKGITYYRASSKDTYAFDTKQSPERRRRKAARLRHMWLGSCPNPGKIEQCW